MSSNWCFIIFQTGIPEFYRLLVISAKKAEGIPGNCTESAAKKPFISKIIKEVSFIIQFIHVFLHEFPPDFYKASMCRTFVKEQLKEKITTIPPPRDNTHLIIWHSVITFICII